MSFEKFVAIFVYYWFPHHVTNGIPANQETDVLLTKGYIHRAYNPTNQILYGYV